MAHTESPAPAFTLLAPAAERSNAGTHLVADDGVLMCGAAGINPRVRFRTVGIVPARTRTGAAVATCGACTAAADSQASEDAATAADRAAWDSQDR